MYYIITGESYNDEIVQLGIKPLRVSEPYSSAWVLSAVSHYAVAKRCPQCTSLT